MFWAADMKLTEILATTCGLITERFASSINNQPAFGRSYSARQNDSDDFGLTFDGIRKHFRHSQANTPRSFLDSSYVNCEYRDDMIETTMRGCFKSLETATKAQRPVRHIFLLPFDSAKRTFALFKQFESEKPQDCRLLTTMPPNTYCFWMFGYWLGMNKLQKTEELSYQDGDLALFVFDNTIARIQTPMDIRLQKEIAAWIGRHSRLQTSNAR